MKGTALYPGAFKPPTRGHFLLVKSLLDNSYIAADVDRASGEFTRPEEKPEVTGVKVFIGTQARNGITQEVSKQIWDIYSKYLKGNIEVTASDRNPVADVYSLLKHNPDTPFFPVVGYRDSSDLADLKRFDDAKTRYPNMSVLTVYSEPEDTTRATNLRQAIIDGDDKEAAKYLPAELNAKDLQAVIDLLKSTVTIEERMNYAMEQVMLGMLTEEREEKKEEVEEVTMGTPMAPIAVIPSELRQRMQDLTTYFQKLAPDDVSVDFNGQSIVIFPLYYNKNVPADYTPEQEPIEEYQDTAAAINYVPYIAGILEHMLKKGMTVLPLPEIKTREDEENAANVFGRTAYYDPTKKEVVLYVTGRHPKDVLRSFCHEMIHHMQNLEGRLPLITTTNTQEDAALNEIEKEAHYLGSMTMREYEDSVKNGGSLEEGTKYRSIVADVRRAVNDALNALLSGKKLKGYNVKTQREPSKADAKLASEYGMSALGLMLNTEKQFANLGSFTSKSEKGTPTTVEVELKFALSDQVKQGTFYVDGSADSDEGSLEIMLAFNPADGTNMLQQIQPTLTDLIRHETEHLTQSGDQVKPDKWMRKDEARRKAIRQNPESWYKYFMLPKEVDANIQGLYTKSKYEKKDFQSTVDQYLDNLVKDEIVTVGNKQKIYDLWKSRIPQIGGIPNLK
jgi:hypothetical protein